MIYVLFASIAIYLILVVACNANQTNDVCFAGLRTFIGALALITFVDFMTGWDSSLSAATTNRGASPEQAISLPSAETGLPTSNTEKSEGFKKSASNYRLESRAGKFLAQGEHDFIMNQHAVKRVRRIHEEDRMRLAARTAMLGILLRRAGK